MELTNVLKDDHGRSINYLRLSVTDRCNLRCRYCMPQKNFTFLPRQDILSYEEMLQIITVAVQLKISKLRLTGGEPLVRRDFIGFLGRIRRLQPEMDIRLTTNGTLLEKSVPARRGLGITCVNVSLDTLKAEKFAQITGRDLFHRVWRGLELAVDQGLRLKINAVAMKGFNQEDLPGFMDLARKWPVDVRFIEFMPIGDKCLWEERHFWPASDILARAEELATLSPLEDAGKTHGPARLYTIDGGRGRFGLITPMSSHFCGSCNRLRVTADGRLRTCLFSETEYRLRPLLRSSKLGPDKLLTVLRLASRRKPIGHEVIARELQKAGTQPRRGMSAIGG